MNAQNSTPGPLATRRHYGKLSPLSYERIAILTAIAEGPLTKSEIPKKVLSDTVAAVVLKKSSAYQLINKLIERGYITQTAPYDLTDTGWRTLQNELKRIEYQRLILKQRLHV